MMDSHGMMVLMVVTESPAWHANMKVGDILLEVEGRQIDKIDDFYKAIAGAHGKTLQFKIDRKGKEIVVNVKMPLQ